jgi:hypothetical protein
VAVSKNRLDHINITRSNDCNCCLFSLSEDTDHAKSETFHSERNGAVIWFDDNSMNGNAFAFLTASYYFCTSKTSMQSLATFFLVHGTVYRESMLTNVQQDATIHNLLYLCKLLYMFRVVTPPIIRSTFNCNYSTWHWSNRLCYLPYSCMCS